MFQSLLKLLDAEVSGLATKKLVARISQWHRIQASPMYREAAQWLHGTLQSWGVDSSIESHPSREGLWAWGEPLFQEWWCEEATLDLVHGDDVPQRLADYRAVPLSLLPRSAPANGEYEVVSVERGTRAEDYDGIDVRGKIVLTERMPLSVYPMAIERFGAAGVIFYGMRSVPEVCPPGDLPDEIQYASWWWWGGEQRAFGFALSPRRGTELRRRVEQAAQQGEPLRVRALVRSHFADGQIESVTATVPGESDEQVLVMGHLCHPAPFANDNASGAAVVMETARALHALIAGGTLPRPKRTIRFLWVPEMTGTYLYLAAHEDEIPRTVAGLNLDMVGEDQRQCGSSWLLVRTSEALPSFAPDLLETLREGLFGAAHTFEGKSEYPLFRHAAVPTSNGSDHYILSDPSVGIPTPMMIEWPDRFYHTTADTLEKVSPAALQRNAVVSGSYAYFIANAGPREVAWLAHEMNARFARRTWRTLQSAVTAALTDEKPVGAPWAQRVAFWIDRQEVALASLLRLDPAFDPHAAQQAARSLAEAAWQQSSSVLADWHPVERPDLDEATARLVLRRRYRGPVGVRAHLRLLPPDEREAARAEMNRHDEFTSLAGDIALYWADGQRTLGEILDLVELETDVRSPDGLASYVRLLERLELVALEG